MKNLLNKGGLKALLYFYFTNVPPELAKQVEGTLRRISNELLWKFPDAGGFGTVTPLSGIELEMERTALQRLKTTASTKNY